MHIDSIKIAGTEFDRRKKLSDSEKEEIKNKYISGSFSLRELGREYRVSKKTIKHIVDEAEYLKSKEYNAEYAREKRRQDKENCKIAHKKATQHTRSFKKKLLEEGLIKGF